MDLWVVLWTPGWCYGPMGGVRDPWVVLGTPG